MIGLAVAGCAPASPTLDVIVDHDGGVDDLIAIALLMRSPSVRVHAITICPGDSYLEPATRATQLVLERLGGRNVAIAQGHSAGVNPFPAQWREDAGRILTIPAISSQPQTTSPIEREDAARVMARLLSGDRKYTILETGPLTNVADALTLNPAIANNISRIYVMGGAVRVKGNVDQRGHDGSAEWNIFNEPRAADAVIRSGVAVTLVPLDATNKVPLTRRFLDRLRAQTSVASQLASQSWSLVETQAAGDQYYFWDTLTAAAMLDPRLVTTQPLKIRVMTGGPSQGRTAEDPAGTVVAVALDANRDRVEQLFLAVLGR